MTRRDAEPLVMSVLRSLLGSECKMRHAVVGVVLLTFVTAIPADELLVPSSVGTDIRVVSQKTLSPRLTEYILSTPAVDVPTPVRVIMPREVQEAGERRFPVLYLLHGGGDDYRSWTNKGEAERLTEDYSLIVVMPDTSSGGWYTNWFNKGAGGNPRWETYHVEQLMAWVDATFPTIARREGRAIAGLSMGGFGAMSYAARHPDRFVLAAAFSGFVNIGEPVFVRRLERVFPLLRVTPEQLFGNFATEAVRWRGRSPYHLAENLRGLTLVLRTGNGQVGNDNPFPDPIEHSVYGTMVSLHQRFDELEIEHTWDDYGPAGHRWANWQRSLAETLPIMMKVFANRPSIPTEVTFAAIEPEYQVFGWCVKTQRPALEFSRLKNAGKSGFEFEGSGEVTVTTPARLFMPGERVLVTSQLMEGQAESQQLSADDQGALTIKVSLGPANKEQQYTDGSKTVVFRATVTFQPVTKD